MEALMVTIFAFPFSGSGRGSRVQLITDKASNAKIYSLDFIFINFQAGDL
jgi:hypothetical protein